MNIKSLTIYFITVLLIASNTTNAQLNVTGNHTAAQMVQKLLGTGITVSNETLTCDSTVQSGLFTAVGTNLGIDSGIVLTSGAALTQGIYTGVSGMATNNCSNTAPTSYTDADLATLVGTTTSDINDACKLEFDFVPTGDTVKFNYVFGSDEYPTYNCSQFNDVFGFFISGPGLVGNQNIALVPGTTIPVAINSVNSGANLGTLCTSMGPGSPFTNLYVNNTGGTTVAYNGFTQVFTATAITVPCSTYHIKLAIADKTDHVLDSGVFIEAGSLQSTGVVINNTTATFKHPQDYIVEGCMPINIKISIPSPKPYPINLNLAWSGTATNGVDYPAQSSTKTIAPNTSLDSIYFTPVQDFVTEGVETLTLKIYNTTSCSNILIDSITYFINDSIILDYSPLADTICPGDTVLLTAGADTSINLAWSPGNSLSNPNADTTQAFPTVSTTYTLLATYNNCPLRTVDIPINVVNNLKLDAGPDDTICVGVPINLTATPQPSNFVYTYEWTPPGGFNDPTLRTPTYTPSTLGTQVLSVKATMDTGCFVYDTVEIYVIEDDFSIINSDTAICHGNSVQMGVNGSTLWDYKWSPPFYLNDTTISDPISTPDSSITYFVEGKYPGCMAVTKAFNIDVQPNPIVDIGPDTSLCDYESLYLESDVQPTGYQNYSYTWTPNNVLTPTNAPDATFLVGGTSSTVNLSVTTPAGCVGDDEKEITVNPGGFLSFEEVDTGFCVPAQLQLGLTGASTYKWTPGVYLSDSTIADPTIEPLKGIEYVVIGTSAENCNDTAYVSLETFPSAILELGEQLEVYDGESVNLRALGNCSYFRWNPSAFLDYDDISNPTLSGIYQDLTYIVTGRTLDGCETSDTLEVLYNDGIIIEMPNAFNPADGPVKIIKKGNWVLDSYEIYNRWGQKVFATADVDEGWDGTFKNEAQPISNYVYVIQAHKLDGEKLNKKGNILLIK